jgi:hypothetical protein
MQGESITHYTLLRKEVCQSFPLWTSPVLPLAAYAATQHYALKKKRGDKPLSFFIAASSSAPHHSAA